MADRILRPDRFDADPHSSTAADQWVHWRKTFENFLSSIESLNVDPFATLTNYISPSVFKHISDHNSYESAIGALQSLYIQPKNVIFARHVLSTTKQENGQSLCEFLQKLKTLASDCNFQAVSADLYREESIRDSFIRGLNSSSIRQRLLEQKSLDLKSAFDLARQLELAQHQSQSYNQVLPHSCSVRPQSTETSTVTAPAICDTQYPVSVTSTFVCDYCGLRRHPRVQCPARDVLCKSCGKKGHYQRVCRASKSYSKASANGHSASVLNTVLSSVTTAAAPTGLSNAVINVHVNNIMLTALVDTGSSESYVSNYVVRRYKWSIHSSRQQVTMASTHLSSFTLGHCLVSLRFKGDVYKHVKLSILPDLCTDVLLGHDFLNRHKSVEIPFGGAKPTLSLCNLIAANVAPQSLFQHLSPDCRPIVTKSRRYSVADENFIRAEVDRLLCDGVIEPSDSPWRAQVLVTSNERQKRRMVVDYSQTINRFTYLDAYPLPKIDKLITKVSQFSVYSTFDLRSAYHQIPIKENEKSFTAFEACGRLYQFTRIPFGVTNGVACFQRTIDEIIRIEKLNDTFAYLDNVTICGNTVEEHDLSLTRFLDVARKYKITLNEDKSIIRADQINLLGYEVSKGVIKPDPERLRPLIQLPPPENLKAQERIIGMFAYYSQWIARFSDKISILVRNRIFPLPEEAVDAFENLKKEIQKALVVTIEPGVAVVVETDASDIAIAASLNQNGRPVAFFSRTLSHTERKHSAVEKEAQAIVEALKKWRHFLIGNHFILVTDQRSLAFVFDNNCTGKVKNEKIQRWRLELSNFHYDVVYRPGTENKVADTFSRNLTCSVHSTVDIRKLHESLCHPGLTRMFHFVRSRNLPFSLEDVKQVITQCRTCAETKPRFFNPSPAHLIKATQPFERLSIDFKGPVPSTSRNKYFLTIVDEFSRFPFAYPCPDVSASTVIRCLTNLFSIFGLPSFIHSDRGTSFMSEELRKYLHEKGVATSRTTPYNPQSNGQVERVNGIIWKSILLALKSRKLTVENWEVVLPDALHSIRSLLCTATNCTPHERMFHHNRKSTTGLSLPSWLVDANKVLLRKQNRSSKYDPLVEEVDLLECNPTYARVRLQDGREDTVSLRNLAPAVEDIHFLEPTPDLEIETEKPTPDFEIETENDENLSTEETPTVPNTLEPFHNEEYTVEPSAGQYKSILQKQQRVHPYNLRNREA